MDACMLEQRISEYWVAPCTGNRRRPNNGSQKGKRLWEMLSLSLKGTRLEARVIEGDVLDLEYVEADIVRGNRVILGKGARFGKWSTEMNCHSTRKPRSERPGGFKGGNDPHVQALG